MVKSEILAKNLISSFINLCQTFDASIFSNTKFNFLSKIHKKKRKTLLQPTKIQRHVDASNRIGSVTMKRNIVIHLCNSPMMFSFSFSIQLSGREKNLISFSRYTAYAMLSIIAIIISRIYINSQSLINYVTFVN